jgi:hypothetical protein
VKEEGKREHKRKKKRDKSNPWRKKKETERKRIRGSVKERTERELKFVVRTWSKEAEGVSISDEQMEFLAPVNAIAIAILRRRRAVAESLRLLPFSP